LCALSFLFPFLPCATSFPRPAGSLNAARVRRASPLTAVCPSPEDKAQELEALQKVYRIWEARKRTSRDAAHAARVMGAIIRKVEAGEARAVPPEVPSQPSPSFTAADPRPPAGWNADWVMAADDMAEFDGFLDDPSTFNWVSGRSESPEPPLPPLWTERVEATEGIL